MFNGLGILVFMVACLGWLTDLWVWIVDGLGLSLPVRVCVGVDLFAV